MKQNIYDNPEFFTGYKTLRDGDKVLNELLEQPVMKRLLLPVQNKTVLDMGCGLGHHYCHTLFNCRIYIKKSGRAKPGQRITEFTS